MWDEEESIFWRQEVQVPNVNPISVPCWRDYLLVAGFCVLLFGYSLVGGRPLTMHEGILPQTAREMYHTGDWIIPRVSGMPWLERPPFPQWVTVVIATAFGRCDQIEIVRLGPLLMATVTVLLTVWMAGLCLGRIPGILSGLLLATMYEFVNYAWLAEQDMFLCTIVTSSVALFIKLEFSTRNESPSALPASKAWPVFWGQRSWTMLLFFMVLGMTNLAKGLLFGTVMALTPIAAYLLWNAEPRALANYCWLWGWLAFIAIAGAWPLAAYSQYPDVLALWRYDHLGRLNGAYTAINQPIWYYPVNLCWEIAPWTPVAFLGLGLMTKAAWNNPATPARFFWCWALAPIALFSLPSGKHHHYLLHCMVPWAVLGSIGLLCLWGKMCQIPTRLRHPAFGLLCLGIPGAIALAWAGTYLPGPKYLAVLLVIIWIAGIFCLYWGWSRQRGTWAFASVLTLTSVAYMCIHSCVLPYTDQCLEDTAFLRQVSSAVGSVKPLYMNGNLGSMDNFRALFYLPPQTGTVKNLTYLLDEKLHDPEIYLVSRLGDESILREFGTPTLVFHSARSRRESSPAGRLALFRIQFHQHLARVPDEQRWSPLQVMGREPQPTLR